MALNVTLRNPIGLSSINDGIAFDPDVSNLIPSVYENSLFSVEIVYQLVDDLHPHNEIPTRVFLVKYSCEDIIGMSIDVIENNVLRLRGALSKAFVDMFYKFIMPDYSIKNLNPDTQEDFLSLVEWAPPINKIRQFNHTIITRVKDEISSIEQDSTLTISQSVHWQVEPALAKFYEFLSKSKI